MNINKNKGMELGARLITPSFLERKLDQRTNRRAIELGARLITILIMVLIVALFVAMVSTGETRSRFTRMMGFEAKSTEYSEGAGQDVKDLTTYAWQGQKKYCCYEPTTYVCSGRIYTSSDCDTACEAWEMCRVAE